MKKLTLKEMTCFSMLGAVLYVARQVMAPFPNIHPVGMFIVTFTIVYRFKALIPLYIFVLLEGILCGFNLWWIPYTYIWTVLWGITMLLPKNLPVRAAVPLYVTVCALHGLAYGTLYAPFQALVYGYDFKKTILWISTGFPYDIIHALGNLAMGFLIVPMAKLLKILNANVLR